MALRTTHHPAQHEEALFQAVMPYCIREFIEL